MKKNIRNILTTVILSFFVCISNVFAEVVIIEREDIEIDGKTVYKMYSNTEMGEVDIVRATGAIVKISVDGVNYDAFCIDFGVNISTGVIGETLNIYEYYRNVLSDAAAKELIKTITLYAKFGYGSPGKTSGKYYLATQQLIWQAINDTGFFNSDFYKERSGYKYNIENLGWTTDQVNKTRVDLTAEIQAIKKAIKDYYLTPSFCSSQNKLEIEIGETAEYTDNNGVLSSYNVTCEDGLTCQTNGNKLTVKAANEAGSKKITFTKPASGTENVIYRSGTGQGVIINQGTLEAVSCEFGVNTFENVQTSDMQIVYIVVIGLFCGTMAYITYYTKKSLDQIN